VPIGQNISINTDALKNIINFIAANIARWQKWRLSTRKASGLLIESKYKSLSNWKYFWSV
jgi:hypothetical protein